MKLIKEKIPVVSCPWYVKDWISNFSGLQCQDTTLEQVGKLKPKTFVVDEDFIISKTEEVFKTMEDNGIQEMVIHVLHIYKFNGTILQRLDHLAAGKKVHFISMSYKVRDFKNIIAHSHDMAEHGLSHDFNYILSQKLQSKRSPDLDFLFMVNTKNIFRRQLSSALKESGILDGSIVRDAGSLNYKNLVEKQKQTIDSIESQLPSNLCVDALRNWPRLPDFSAYERIFCEVVIESANTQIDKTSDGELTDLSDKTYKPIMLGVPFVFLGSKSMFLKLLEDGYRLIDDGSFYNKWHSGLNFNTSVAHLVDFLKQIKQDETLRKKLQLMAQHNYDHFWTVRKYHHRTQGLEICRKCFGETVFDSIYDVLNI